MFNVNIRQQNTANNNDVIPKPKHERERKNNHNQKI